MTNIFRSFSKLLFLIFIASTIAKADEVRKANLPDRAFETIEWTDLIPEDDLNALLNPPDYIASIPEGSAQDFIGNQAGADDRYQQALVSTKIVPEMDGRHIKIPGFVVPLEFDDELTITEFFLVPFFGACIHIPPPPPNQIIFVEYPKGFKLDALYTPFWITGVIETSMIENDMATSAYSMKMDFIEEYALE